MPTFIKDKDAAGEAPAAPAPAEPAAEPASAPQEPPPQAAQPFQQPAPPPLPKEPEAAPPGHPAPPPLDPKRSSTYVMKGSGEGRMDSDEPWAAAPEAEEAPAAPAQPVQPFVPPPEPEADKVSFQLPAAAPEAAAPAEKPAAVEVPKPKRTGLWVIVVIILVGAGGFAAWYFVKQSALLEGDSGDDPVKPAGIVPAEVVKDAGPADAGEAKAADGQPEEAADAGKEVAKKEEKKEEPAKKKKRKRRKKDVAKREPGKRPAELALEYYKKGNALIRKKRFKEAISLFRKALRTNKKLAIAHRGLGICYAQMRDNKRACREYRIYLKMIPKDSKEVPTLKQILKSCK
jgi:hypothetical protein